MAGGFLGDFIKGHINDVKPSALDRGLLLHRHIDVQSNRLPSMRSTYHRFGSVLRRPAPILLDLVADHVFAKHWDEFGDRELATFTASCYEAIDQHCVPAKARRFYAHMRDTDLLARYADLQVIEDIMVRILKRLRFDNCETELARCLREHERAFYDDFCVYFEDLTHIAESWCQEHKLPCR